jgi:hypothetical protein
MAETNESLPVTDDIPVQADNGPTEAELLDAVLRNSEFIAGESLPDEEIPEVDPSESDEEDPEESDEVVNEDGEEGEDTDEDETLDEDASEDATQDSTVFTADDLDLDAKVLVKINGEEVPVSFSDLLKGYSTEQSLSAKGRELGEARKQLEAEREEQLAEINKIGQASAAVLYQEEQSLAKQYHDIEAKIKEARSNGDTYELSELKDKREEAQANYWEARRKREAIVNTLESEQNKIAEQNWQKQVNQFNETITEYVPDFNEQTATDIREFALKEGLPESLINSIVDPAIVKFVNDYRILKTGVTKGEAKRKQAATKKVPVKKAKSESKKKADQASMVKARAFREDASSDDQMAFLKQLASRSLNQ